MKTEECRLVPYAEQAAYLDAGWTIKPLSGPHAFWRVLAVRETADG